MEYFDEDRKDKYVPHVIEPSFGVDRLMLAVITSAYAEDTVGSDTRTVLRFHPRLAPIKAAVLPLVKSNSKLVEKETFTATVCLQGLYPLHDNE